MAGRPKDTSKLSPEELEKYLKTRAANERAALRRKGVEVPYLRKRKNPEEMSEEEYQRYLRTLEAARRSNERKRCKKLGIEPPKTRGEQLEEMAETPAYITVEIPEGADKTLPAPDMYRLTRDEYLVTQTYLVRWLLDSFTGVLLPPTVEKQLRLFLQSCDCYLRTSAIHDELKVKL